jgi:hypothetical protein
MRTPRQLSFDERRYHTGHGGPRIGAGRPPLSKNPPVHHVRRPRVPVWCPAHVTLRVRREVPALRQKRFLRELKPSLRQACERGEFRVAHRLARRAGGASRLPADWDRPFWALSPADP